MCYLFINLNTLPWIGFTVALLWSIYNLLRKKINVEADIGLFIESLFILPLTDGIPLLVNSDECGAQEKKEMEAIKPMLMNFIRLIFEII